MGARVRLLMLANQPLIVKSLAWKSRLGRMARNSFACQKFLRLLERKISDGSPEHQSSFQRFPVFAPAYLSIFRLFAPEFLCDRLMLRSADFGFLPIWRRSPDSGSWVCEIGIHVRTLSVAEQWTEPGDRAQGDGPGTPYSKSMSLYKTVFSVRVQIGLQRSQATSRVSSSLLWNGVDGSDSRVSRHCRAEVGSGTLYWQVLKAMRYSVADDEICELHQA